MFYTKQNYKEIEKRTFPRRVYSLSQGITWENN